MRARVRPATMAFLALASFWATASTVAQGPTATHAVDAPSHLTESRSEDGSHDVPVLWLRGPFGKVAGGNRSEPATTPPGGSPLDMAYQRMPLSLEASDPGLLPGIRVTSELVETGQRETLAQGQPVFEGPALPGVQLVIASLAHGGSVVERAWLVDVPERELPEDGLVIDIPAPGVIVSTESGQQVGVMADGCYAFLCVETGPLPPASTLAPLVTRVGETPMLSIEDGSALVAWQGRSSPLNGTHGITLEAAGAITDAPASIVPLDGLEPLARGEWLLEVRVEFDRERGWAWYAYRLIVE